MPAASARVVADRYRLEERLGAGAVGAVWRARDLTLERDVAVKEIPLHTGMFGDADAARSRVLREARAAARLHHPGVVEVFDVIDTEDAAYLIMGLVQAPTLTERVQREGPLDPRAAAMLGLAMLAAIEAAHAAGIVHRDVKPSNVLLPVAGGVVLTDFGIAAVADTATLTAPGTIMGSPSFMAPEQAAGTAVGQPADLWGLGATLYFAVEGVPPYERGSAVATASAVVHEPPRSTRCAGRLDVVLAALLEKDPQQRADVAATRQLLEDIRSGPVVPPAPPSPSRPRPAPAAVGGGVRGQRRSVVAVGATVAVLVLGGAVLALTRGDAADEVVVSPAPPVSVPASPPTTSPPAGPPAAPGALIPSDEPGASERVVADATAPSPGPSPVRSPAGEAASGTGSSSASPEEVATTGSPPTPTPTPVEREASGAPTARDDAGLVTAAGPTPPGWQRVDYEGSATTVAVPPDWTVAERGGTLRDVRAPGGLPYLRLDNAVEAPADPVADWQRQSESFAASHADYETLRIVPVDFRGYDAALWEYTWTNGDGARMRAYNLGIDVEGTGHALNLVARAEDWEQARVLFDGFTQSFEPGAG